MRGALLVTSALVVVAACSDSIVPVGPFAVRPPLPHAVLDGKPLVLSGLGTAAIDGVLSPGEWTDAAAIDFRANLPPHDGGGTTGATLFVMNDAANLYLALRIARPSFGGATNPSFEFDNDHDGVTEVGDDVFGMSVGIFSPVDFVDAFRMTCPGDPLGTAGCGRDDVDDTPPGTTDGAAAATNDGSFTILEMVHPLNGADPAHDFRLGPGQTVGFTLTLHLFALDPTCNFGPDCFADMDFPTGPSNASQFGDIVVGIPVRIDVRPGSATNPINLGAGGVVPVALLGSASLDPGAVDPATLQFAGAPVRRVAGRTDVNADGFPDLLLQFDIPALDLGNTATRAELTGRTLEGAMIRGTDVVSVVPRPRGTPSQLVFSTQPTSATAGAAIAPAVQVTVRDVSGDVVTNFTRPVTIAITTNPGDGTLVGTTTVGAVAGVATFANLGIDKAGNGYQLSAIATGLIPATSAAFDVAAGAPAQLVFAIQPTNTTAGDVITPSIRVRAQDFFGNIVQTFTGAVTVAITAGTGTLGASLSGSRIATAASGVATFSNLAIDKTGTGYTLTATAVGLTGTSTPFNITPGTATRLVFSVQPITTKVGDPITPAVQVSAQDLFGNLAWTFTGNITVAIAVNPAGGALTGTMTVAAFNGVAEFTNLRIDKIGRGYELSATASDLTGATSAAFDIIL